MSQVDWRFVITAGIAGAVAAIVWQLCGYPARK
jgi:hypothetical protein